LRNAGFVLAGTQFLSCLLPVTLGATLRLVERDFVLLAQGVELGDIFEQVLKIPVLGHAHLMPGAQRRQQRAHATRRREVGRPDLRPGQRILRTGLAELLRVGHARQGDVGADSA
jgi:hypothetical protein